MTETKGDLSKFTDLELWHFHAYDYAWRRVFLGISDTRSRLDPEGDWFNGGHVDAAEAYLRERFRHRSAPSRSAADLEAETVRDAWAREHGCASFKSGMGAGLQIVAKRRAGQRYDSGVPQLADVTTRDPNAARQAAERIGVRT